MSEVQKKQVLARLKSKMVNQRQCAEIAARLKELKEQGHISQKEVDGVLGIKRRRNQKRAKNK